MARRAAVTVGTVRLASGLVLFAFVACHLLNIAFGIVSVETQNAARRWLLGAWLSVPGTGLLVVAAFAHVGVNLYTLYRRRTLRLRAWEAAQYVTGFLVPVLLAQHAIGTVVMPRAFQVNVDYYLVQISFWVARPFDGALQAVLLLVAWTHGTIGLWHWLKVKAWFATARPVLLALFILVPTLALSGYIAAGNEIRRVVAADPEFVEFVLDDANVTPASQAFAAELTRDALAGYGAILAAVLAAWWLRRAGTELSAARAVYGDGRSMALLPGATLLETLRANGIPHPSVCGGRGRCTTCRVLVREGLPALPSPGPVEAAALARIGSPEQVRLACQIRPAAAISVVPLLKPNATAADGRRPGHLLGQERIVTVLFVDLRGSTGLGEARLPYDTLFILNRFFAEMTQALRETGGHYANFTGDGLMAIYGLNGPPEAGCRQALKGAGRMLERLAALNGSLSEDLPVPLRIGIGIHTGEAIVGEMGPPEARIVSAIGDTVNLAARLEGLSKELGKPVVVSQDAVRRGAIDLPGARPVRRKVRGREQAIAVYAIDAVPAGL